MNRIFEFVLLLVFSFSVGICGPSEQQPTEKEKISTKVELVRSGAIKLRITITNSDTKDSYLYFPPWYSYKSAMEIFLFVRDKPETYAMDYWISSDAPLINWKHDPIKIEGLSSVVGEVDLNERYPVLAKQVATSGVYMFWCFSLHISPEPHLEKAVQLPPVGGFFYLKQESGNQ